MNIENAKKLKVGDIVHFPADRGDLAGYGRVAYISYIEQTHALLEEPFLWVSVQPLGRSAGMWPSNRLG